MLRYLFLIATIVGAISVPLASAEEPTNDWLLIPDRRAGPITRDWTGADLVRAFGTLHCRAEEIGIGEGETVPGYVLYGGTDNEMQVHLSRETGRVVSVAMHLNYGAETDPTTGEFFESRIIPRKTLWRSISGITLGSTVPEVTKVNGGPFSIIGWETDIAGAVTSWKNGNIPDTFEVRFNYGNEATYQRLWNKVLSGNGTGTWDDASDGATMTQLDLTVGFIQIRL